MSFIHAFVPQRACHNPSSLSAKLLYPSAPDKTQSIKKNRTLSSRRHLLCVVDRGLRGRALGRCVALGHAAVDNKVGAVNEAALVTSKEHDGLRLLHGLAESAGREVDFAAVALGRIVAEPVLEEGCAARC
jgi:hypothetical protein